MTTKNQRLKHAGDRDRILAFMENAGLTLDLARREDPPERVLNSLRRFFQGLAAALQKKGIVYPEPVPTGVEAEEWKQIDTILDRAVDVYAASRVMGLREGIERGCAALTIGYYYKNYPERLLIAKYIRKYQDASPKDICKYIDTEERKRISSSPPGLPSPRPYPLPWESKPLTERISLSMEDCAGEWNGWTLWIRTRTKSM